MRIALRLNLDSRGAETCPFAEMSRGMQRIYSRTLRRFSAHENVDESATKIVPKLHARVTVNGREFGDVEANAAGIPPLLRRYFGPGPARAARGRHRRPSRALQFHHAHRHALPHRRGCAAAIVYLWTRGYYG